MFLIYIHSKMLHKTEARIMATKKSFYQMMKEGPETWLQDALDAHLERLSAPRKDCL